MSDKYDGSSSTDQLGEVVDLRREKPRKSEAQGERVRSAGRQRKAHAHVAQSVPVVLCQWPTHPANTTIRILSLL
jgi:hypothetical protein